MIKLCKYCEEYKTILETSDLEIEQNNGEITIHTGFGSDKYKPNYCFNCGRDLRIKPPKDNTFTLKCNKCGAATVIWSKDLKGYKEFKYNNQKIKIGSSNMEETFIWCKCGNEVLDG